MALVCVASAQTTVSETAFVTVPGGGLASGTITLTPSAAFVSASGVLVERRPIQVTVTNGSFSVALHPNDTADPANTTYAADYSLRYATCSSCRSLTRSETWKVTTGGPLRIADVVFVGGGSGSGDVVGPASSTGNAIARYNLATGKLLKNSAATLDDNGLPTFGIGVAGWTFNVGTAGGGTAKSGIVINGGDGALNTEPGFLKLGGSSGGIASYLFACGSAGKVCVSSTEPSADSSGYLVSDRAGSIQFILDGGGAAITTGAKGWIRVPFACTITGWELTADQSGSIVLDLWKDTYANFPPTVLDTITAAAKPTLSAVQKNTGSPTGWTTAVAAGDYIRVNVDSAATVTYAVLSIQVTKQ